MQVIRLHEKNSIRLSLIAFNLILLIPFILIMPAGHGKDSGASHRYALSNDGSVYRWSKDDGWDEIMDGLPDEIEPAGIYASPAQGGYVYLATGAHGLFRLDPEADSWRDATSPLFRTQSMYKRPQAYRKISAFAADSQNPFRILCATKHDLYESFDRGDSWRPLPRPGISSRCYITSLAVNGNTILAGTSFAGIFISTGGNFRQINSGLPYEPYSAGLHFYDEVTSLCIDSSRPARFYAGFASGKGLYSCRNGSSWKEELKPDSKNRFYRVDSISGDGDSLIASIGGSLYKTGSDTWSNAGKYPDEPPFDRSSLFAITYADKKAFRSFYSLNRNFRNKRSSRIESLDRKAIYASVPAVRAKLDSLIRIIKKSGFNSIVIDMKDDFGCVYFPTKNKTVAEIGSARKPLPVSDILKKLKKNEIYAIARIVVFKDRELYQAYKGRYAIMDRDTGLPWKGSRGEFWVDPHSTFVHDYNIDLASDLEDLGFDEIQFDYIRFPSDGPIDRCVYSHRKFDDSYKSETLADFLYAARARLEKPISADIYGFNSWYRFGNTIGQDMEEFARHADIICPMVYPSHFGSRFYAKFKGDDKTYRLVYDGGIRAHVIAGPAVIRPYLQAFKLLSPNWGPGYVSSQMRGAVESGCSGFSYWNASGKYDILPGSFPR